MRLGKPKIPKFCGNAQKRPEFWIQAKLQSTNHIYQASKNFNYLKTVIDEANANAISGLGLTKDNYGEAVNILKD